METYCTCLGYHTDEVADNISIQDIRILIKIEPCIVERMALRKILWERKSKDYYVNH